MKRTLSIVLIFLMLFPLAAQAEELILGINHTAFTDETGTWNSSGVKGYNNSPTKYSTSIGGTFTWKSPFTTSTTASVSYYAAFLPNSADTGTNCDIQITYETNRTKTVTLENLKENTWISLGNFQFDGVETEGITIINTGAGNARATNVKFVETTTQYEYYLITPNQFFETGGWQLSNNSEAFNNTTFLFSGGSMPAKMSVPMDNDSYYLYMHTCDYPDYGPGNRLSYLKINGTDYRKSTRTDKEGYFGSHQVPHSGDYAPGSATSNTPVWDWEQMGYPSSTFSVSDGLLSLELYNALGTSNARVDGILITNDPDYTPINNLSAVNAACSALGNQYPYQDQLTFPVHAQENGTPQASYTLENQQVKVEFRLLRSTGGAVVQRQTTVQDTVVNHFTDGLGWMCLFADQTQALSSAPTPLFRTSFQSPGTGTITTSTNNIYASGVPSWLVADTLTQEGDRIVMTGQNDFVSFTAAWTLASDDKEPKVDMVFLPKKDGRYSFGMFNNVNEVSREQINYILAPYRYQEMRIPEPGIMVPESSSTTALTQSTYKPGTLSPDKEVTLGVVVDPSALEYHWVYNRSAITRAELPGIHGIDIDTSEKQSNYGLGISGPMGEVLPALFAPMMSTYDSQQQAGVPYTYSYRPTASVSQPGEGWYDAYTHVVNDLLQVTSYRDNYFESMTNTAFNMYRLLLDDYASGWDENAKAHYNMEDSNWVTNSDPLSYFQFYLLTEDREMLERRTIPTMEYILTRQGPHLHTDFSIRGEAPGTVALKPHQNNSGMGNSVYGGAYYMTRGQVPVYKAIASEKFLPTNVAQGTGKSLTNSSEWAWYNKMTGTQKESLTAAADDYLTYRIHTPATRVIPDENFIYIDFYPHFQSLVDAYEETQDSRYLDGAIEGAKQLLPCLWAGPMPDLNKTVTYDQDEVMTMAKTRSGGATMFFRGPVRDRIGLIEVRSQNDTNPLRTYFPIDFTQDAILQDEAPYPEWVTSRVGLGLEQTTTFNGVNQGNILMSTWAGELLRLGKEAGDETMMHFARNSIVGRYANYPGYYYNQFQTFISDKDFPYHGPDTSHLYFHHIPVMLGAIQDYLFSNAFVLSDGAVDFPTTRNQGYAWFNNRHYGYESGNMYGERDMWPWFKEGTITISAEVGNDAKQIDWIGGRKDGRAAFALTNASKQDQRVTVSIDPSLGVKDGTAVTVYAQNGSTSTFTAQNNQVTLTVPSLGIQTIAFDGANIQAPNYSTVQFDAAAAQSPSTDTGSSEVYLMMDGTTPSNEQYDIKGFSLAIDPSSYYGYVFVNRYSTTSDAEKGIQKAVLSYQIEGQPQWYTMEDTTFPFEFTVPVADPDQTLRFTVTLTQQDGSTKTSPEGSLSKMPTVLSYQLTSQSINGGMTGSIAAGGDLTLQTTVANNTSTPQNVTAVFCLYQDGRLLKILDAKTNQVPANGTFDFQTAQTLPANATVKTIFLKGDLPDISPLCKPAVFK